MFERFTDKARTVVISARAEAAERGDQLRPVYMLYALTTGEGVAARALAGLGVDAARVQRELDRPTALGRPLEGLGDEPDSGDADGGHRDDADRAGARSGLTGRGGEISAAHVGMPQAVDDQGVREAPPTGRAS